MKGTVSCKNQGEYLHPFVSRTFEEDILQFFSCHCSCGTVFKCIMYRSTCTVGYVTITAAFRGLDLFCYVNANGCVSAIPT